MTADIEEAKEVALSVNANLLARFFQVLGQGVYLEVQVGCSLKDLLCSQLGIPAEYLENRIQTIFLNAKPVDNVAAATAGPGATIALSAAMPGLVGAVMRKGGHYAALRAGISHGKSTECPAAARDTIRLKLFNLVAAELGPEFLSRGVGMRGEDFYDFIARHGDELSRGSLEMAVDGNTVGIQSVLGMDWEGTAVILTVVPAIE